MDNHCKVLILIGSVVLVSLGLYYSFRSKESMDVGMMANAYIGRNGGLNAPANNGFSPMNSGPGFLQQYNMNSGAGSDLIKWWFDYTEKLNPDVAGVIYALCNLQTKEAILYYGVTKEVVDTLKSIKPLLDGKDPKLIYNAEDVYKLLGSTCAMRLDDHAGVVTQSGLYNQEEDFPGVVNVF